MPLRVDIPGWGHLDASHLLLDQSAAYDTDGVWIPGVAERLLAIAPRRQRRRPRSSQGC